jgi:hypothetical protein
MRRMCKPCVWYGGGRRERRERGEEREKFMECINF